MDLKSIIQATEQIAKDKGIPVEKVYEAIEGALAAAYKKEQSDKGAVIRAKLDPATGEVEFTRVKEVVDESTVRIVPEGEEVEEEPVSHELTEGEEERLPRYNEERHILIAEAKKIKKDVVLGEELCFPMPPSSDFGRIATQAAKQRIIQMLRKAEREAMISEFKDKEGQVVSGVIQRFDRGNVYVDLGRTIALLPRNEAIPGEHYTVNDRMRFFILSVGTDSESRMPVLLSRAHPKFVAELFRMEVPEVADGAVTIKAIAREAGSRTKIAVASNAPGVDAVGSCVGQRGTRVMTVTNELGSEKIDIVEWSQKPEEFIGNALAPAKAKGVEILNEHEVRVLVQDDQLSLAIGKGGQNVRLAAKLTGWKIDVRPASNPDKVQEGGVATEEGSSTEAENETAPETGAVETNQKPIYHKPDEDE